MAKPSLKVQIECGEMKTVVEGDVDEVLKGLVQFLTGIYPNYETLAKFTFSPDYVGILKDLSEFVKVTPEGQLVLLKRDLPADEAIGSVLLGAHLALKLGRLDSDDISADELAKIVGKSLKTVQNTVVEMMKAAILDRSGRGTYKLTPLGIKEVHEALKAQSESQNSGGEV